MVPPTTTSSRREEVEAEPVRVPTRVGGPLAVVAAAVALVVTAVVAVSFGRYTVPVSHVVQILASGRALRRRRRRDRENRRRAHPAAAGTARRPGRRRAGGRRRSPAGDVPQPVGESGHHRCLGRSVTRRIHRAAARTRNGLPRRWCLRVRPRRARAPLRPDHGPVILDAHGRPGRGGARLVLRGTRRAGPVLRRPVLIPAGDRVLVAGQPRHRHLGEGRRGCRADPARHRGRAPAEVAHQRALARRRRGVVARSAPGPRALGRPAVLRAHRGRCRCRERGGGLGRPGHPAPGAHVGGAGPSDPAAR